MNNILFSSKSDEWSTPDYLYDQLNDLYHFDLDPCSTASNAKCKKFYTILDDGLKQSWNGYKVFCNPPYSKIKDWVKKCYQESLLGVPIVLLIPSRTDTSWFHDYIYHKADLFFIRGRLKFGNSKNSAPFPSMICVFNQNKF